MAVLSIPVMLDKQRNLRFGFRAMMAIEERTGRGFLEVARECVSNNPKISTLCDMLWAGFIHEDSELTPEKVADLLDEKDNVSEFIGVVGQAIEMALKEKNDDKKKLGNLFKRLRNS
jgi:hypothetical protein